MADLITRLRALHDREVDRADFGTIYGEAADEVQKLRAVLGRALAVIVEFGNLNGFRNLSDEELGALVMSVAKECAEALPFPTLEQQQRVNDARAERGLEPHPLRNAH